MSLREDAARAYMAAETERLERHRKLLRQRFLATFAREPDTISPERNTVTCDGVVLLLRDPGDYGDRWSFIVRCAECGWYHDWPVTTLAELGKVLAEGPLVLKEHDCPFGSWWREEERMVADPWDAAL